MESESKEIGQTMNGRSCGVAVAVCSRCAERFDAVEFIHGSCPHCGLGYWWFNDIDVDEPPVSQIDTPLGRIVDMPEHPMLLWDDPQEIWTK